MLMNLANYRGKTSTFFGNLTAVFIMIIRLRLWKRQGAGKTQDTEQKRKGVERNDRALHPVILAQLEHCDGITYSN